jgi:hypothetical protein
LINTTDNIKVISHHQSTDQVKVKVECEVLSLSNEGGLSDNDELRARNEAATNSPPKGKKCITSEVTSWLFQLSQMSKIIPIQQLISHKSLKAPGKPAPKKPQNTELPHWIEAQWFQHTFVMTYMAFVGETINPWEVPVKQSIVVMQMI